MFAGNAAIPPHERAPRPVIDVRCAFSGAFHSTSRRYVQFRYPISSVVRRGPWSRARLVVVRRHGETCDYGATPLARRPPLDLALNPQCRWGNHCADGHTPAEPTIKSPKHTANDTAEPSANSDTNCAAFACADDISKPSTNTDAERTPYSRADCHTDDTSEPSGLPTTPRRCVPSTYYRCTVFLFSWYKFSGGQ